MDQNSRKRQLVDEDRFREKLTPYVCELLSFAGLLVEHSGPERIISRPFLGNYFGSATRLEEFLDFYDAKNNGRYMILRQAVAAAKQFSRVCYAILHIRYTSPAYCLLPVEGNFPEATEEAVLYICEAVYSTAVAFRDAARNCGFRADIHPMKSLLEPEDLPSGLLKADREVSDRKIHEKTIVYLASSFLNQSEETRLLSDFAKVKQEDYTNCIPETVSESKLRIVQNRFHNLQALYDTHLSDSNLEQLDPGLPVLRGHISIIYHLTEIGTVLCHFHERHMSGGRVKADANRRHLMTDRILYLLMDYCLCYSYRYLKTAQKLCRNMIQKYSEHGCVELPVPSYRGFHVRPSTMISKIVLHYGARVQLVMDGTSYDAGIPLDLFRVNEKINAIKRTQLASELDALPILQDMSSVDEMEVALRVVFFSLLETKKIVLYEGNIVFNDLPPIEGETLGEYARRGIARFLALGKIDIITDIRVHFDGDTRALQDIRLLAENGYGEDKFGNDIVLPDELSYLRR